MHDAQSATLCRCAQPFSYSHSLQRTTSLDGTDRPHRPPRPSLFVTACVARRSALERGYGGTGGLIIRLTLTFAANVVRGCAESVLFYNATIAPVTASVAVRRILHMGEHRARRVSFRALSCTSNPGPPRTRYSGSCNVHVASYSMVELLAEVGVRDHLTNVVDPIHRSKPHVAGRVAGCATQPQRVPPPAAAARSCDKLRAAHACSSRGGSESSSRARNSNRGAQVRCAPCFVAHLSFLLARCASVRLCPALATVASLASSAIVR